MREVNGLIKFPKPEFWIIVSIRSFERLAEITLHLQFRKRPSFRHRHRFLHQGEWPAGLPASSHQASELARRGPNKSARLIFQGICYGIFVIMSSFRHGILSVGVIVSNDLLQEVLRRDFLYVLYFFNLNSVL